MTFLKKYSDKEKRKYYDSKADLINNHYIRLFNNKRCMTYDDLIITRDNKAYDYCNKMIKSKEYQDDMYKLLYYSARADGENHNGAVKYAKEYVKSIKYNQVVEIRDVNNILKNHIRLEDK